MSNGAEYDQRLRWAMAELVHNFPLAGAAVEETLASVTTAAVELIHGIDHADILLVDQERYDSLASTDPVANQLDALQQRLQQGPCLQAAMADPLIRCTDLRNEPRFPEFAAEATNLGIYSMLSFQLYTHSGGAGALNLLGRTPRALSPEAEALGAMLATHAALALAAVNTQHQFASALASRDHIGQAKGILMERFDFTAVKAFEVLRKLSQDTNVPLRDLAERVIRGR